eukprot:559608-Pelagomonas_calceolata.AAC.11
MTYFCLALAAVKVEYTTAQPDHSNVLLAILLRMQIVVEAYRQGPCNFYAACCQSSRTRPCVDFAFALEASCVCAPLPLLTASYVCAPRDDSALMLRATRGYKGLAYSPRIWLIG